MISVSPSDQILEQLSRVRARCPELRFAQLITTIGMLAEEETGHSLWDVDDAGFAAALERFSSDMARRGSTVAEPASETLCGGVMPSVAAHGPSPTPFAPQN